jgi:microfibrillar-associated protein 1
MFYRRGRVTIQEIEAEAQNTLEALAKREAEAAQRKKESHDLVAESIKRELAESVSYGYFFSLR